MSLKKEQQNGNLCACCTTHYILVNKIKIAISSLCVAIGNSQESF